MKRMNIIKRIFYTILKILRAIVVVSLWFSVVITIMFKYYMYESYTGKKFNSEEWKLIAIEPNEDGHFLYQKRCGMYHDLTSNYLKKGMSIEVIQDLLGHKEVWFYCSHKKIKCMMYGMGFCNYAPSDLYTCFNDKGKLVTYDRDEHCEIQGTYNEKTKEQSCSREGPGGVGLPSNDCGIDPW